MLDKIRNWIAEKISTDRMFKAARLSRLEADWSVSPLKTNEELKANLPLLILRSRDLAKNNSDYIKWLGMRSTNIVGHNGITLMMKVKNPDGKPDKFANQIIENNWGEWGKKRNRYCSYDQQLDWTEIQELVDECLARDGDAFVRVVEGADNPYLFSLQVLDSLDIDINFNAENWNGHRVIMGIELDEKDRPVAYHKLNRQAMFGTTKTRERIPASEIIHLYHVRFPSQVRGFPLATGAILDLNMADGYKETALVGARAAAAQMGIWEPNSAAPGKIDPTKKSDDDAPPEVDVQPGRIIRGKRGWKFTPFTPNQPVSVFGTFLKSIYQSIANGLGVLYNTFRNDFESINFSSLRGGTIAERDVWKCEQRFLIAGFVEFVFARWLKMFLVSGLSNLPFSKYSKFLADTWQPRRWDWVDPVKDANAILSKLNMKITSRTRICSELGTDFDEILNELEQEENELRQRKLTTDVTIEPPKLKGKNNGQAKDSKQAA
jgi:lambda family phage portal protein